MGIIMGILCIGMPEIVGGGGNNNVDAFVRNTDKGRSGVPAYNLVCEREMCRGFIGDKRFFLHPVSLSGSWPSPPYLGPFLASSQIYQVQITANE
jgi:hypothetical protein